MGQPNISEYQVGILCALPHENAAVWAALDEVYTEPAGVLTQDESSSSYTFGLIGSHKVVIACLPAGTTGKAAAATVSKDLKRSFPGIKVGLMVGIGGGAPNRSHDIRLGDIVVAQPFKDGGGVIQYDFGKQHPDGFKATGTLNKPPVTLMGALSRLRARHDMHDGSMLTHHLASILANLKDEYGFPGAEHDYLFESNYEHIAGTENDCTTGSRPCDTSKHKQRQHQSRANAPMVFYGNIASGDQVMRSGTERDRIASDCSALCFDMEAAGLENSFPCIVIRGVCDYADSHKEKRWQKYAAATAAAFAKEFLRFVKKTVLDTEQPIRKSKTLTLPGSDTMRDTQIEEATSYHSLVPYRYQFPTDIPVSLEGVPDIGYFVPRSVEMDRLNAYFVTGNSFVSSRRVFVIYGMGGVGKTQLCIAFAHRSQRRFKHIFWLDGSSMQAILQSLAQSASRELGLLTRRAFSLWTPTQNQDIANTDIHYIVDRFLTWLSSPDNRDWLLIIDNVDRDWRGGRDPQAFNYRNFLPKVEHGNVLITTRLADLQIPQASLHLHNFDDDQALDLLQARAGKLLPDAKPLIARLKGLPLALAQAGAYLGRTPLSVRGYLDLYETTWAKLVTSQNKISINATAERSLLTTWRMSYDQVSAENPTAIGLLLLWAFMDHQKMWFELCNGAMTSAADFSWPMWFRAVMGDEMAFRDSMLVLVSFSLVSVAASGRSGEGDCYTMHPVLHDWTSYHVQEEPQKQALFMMAVCLIARMCHKVKMEDVDNLLPHAKRVANVDEVDIGYQTAEAMETIAQFLIASGVFSEGESILKRALAFYEKESGPGGQETLRVVIKLGDLYTRQDNSDAAKRLYKRSWEEFASTSHRQLKVELMQVGQALAEIHMEKEEWREAEKLLLACQKWKEHARRSRDPFTLDTMERLGYVYWRQDKEDEAEKIWLRALHLSPQNVVSEHIIEILKDLGKMYGHQAKHREADIMFVRREKECVRAFGPIHEKSLYAKIDLANFLEDRGRYSASEDLWQRSLDACRNTDNEDNRAFGHDVFEAICCDNLASTCLLRGKLHKAHSQFLRSVELCERAFGKDHYITEAILERLHATKDNIDYSKRHGIDKSELTGILTAIHTKEELDVEDSDSGDPGSEDINLLIRSRLEQHIEIRTARRRKASSRIPIGARHTAMTTVSSKRPRYHGKAWEDHVSEIMTSDKPFEPPEPTSELCLLQQRLRFEIRRRGRLWHEFARIGLWSTSNRRRKVDLSLLRELFSEPFDYVYDKRSTSDNDILDDDGNRSTVSLNTKDSNRNERAEAFPKKSSYWDPMPRRVPTMSYLDSLPKNELPHASTAEASQAEAPDAGLQEQRSIPRVDSPVTVVSSASLPDRQSDSGPGAERHESPQRIDGSIAGTELNPDTVDLTVDAAVVDTPSRSNDRHDNAKPTPQFDQQERIFRATNTLGDLRAQTDSTTRLNSSKSSEAPLPDTTPTQSSETPSGVPLKTRALKITDELHPTFESFKVGKNRNELPESKIDMVWDDSCKPSSFSLDAAINHVSTSAPTTPPIAVDAMATKKHDDPWTLMMSTRSGKAGIAKLDHGTDPSPDLGYAIATPAFRGTKAESVDDEDLWASFGISSETTKNVEAEVEANPTQSTIGDTAGTGDHQDAGFVNGCVLSSTGDNDNARLQKDKVLVRELESQPKVGAVAGATPGSSNAAETVLKDEFTEFAAVDSNWRKIQAELPARQPSQVPTTAGNTEIDGNSDTRMSVQGKDAESQTQNHLIELNRNEEISPNLLADAWMLFEQRTTKTKAQKKTKFDLKPDYAPTPRMKYQPHQTSKIAEKKPSILRDSERAKEQQSSIPDAADPDVQNSIRNTQESSSTTVPKKYGDKHDADLTAASIALEKDAKPWKPPAASTIHQASVEPVVESPVLRESAPSATKMSASDSTQVQKDSTDEGNPVSKVSRGKNQIESEKAPANKVASHSTRTTSNKVVGEKHDNSYKPRPSRNNKPMSKPPQSHSHKGFHARPPTSWHPANDTGLERGAATEPPFNLLRRAHSHRAYDAGAMYPPMAPVMPQPYSWAPGPQDGANTSFVLRQPPMQVPDSLNNTSSNVPRPTARQNLPSARVADPTSSRPRHDAGRRQYSKEPEPLRNSTTQGPHKHRNRHHADGGASRRERYETSSDDSTTKRRRRPSHSAKYTIKDTKGRALELTKEELKGIVAHLDEQEAAKEQHSRSRQTIRDSKEANTRSQASPLKRKSVAVDAREKRHAGLAKNFQRELGETERELREAKPEAPEVPQDNLIDLEPDNDVLSRHSAASGAQPSFLDAPWDFGSKAARKRPTSSMQWEGLSDLASDVSTNAFQLAPSRPSYTINHSPEPYMIHPRNPYGHSDRDRPGLFDLLSSDVEPLDWNMKYNTGRSLAVSYQSQSRTLRYAHLSERDKRAHAAEKRIGRVYSPLPSSSTAPTMRTALSDGGTANAASDDGVRVTEILDDETNITAGTYNVQIEEVDEE